MTLPHMIFVRGDKVHLHKRDKTVKWTPTTTTIENVNHLSRESLSKIFKSSIFKSSTFWRIILFKIYEILARNQTNFNTCCSNVEYSNI